MESAERSKEEKLEKGFAKRFLNTTHWYNRGGSSSIVVQNRNGNEKFRLKEETCSIRSKVHVASDLNEHRQYE